MNELILYCRSTPKSRIYSRAAVYLSKIGEMHRAFVQHMSTFLNPTYAPKSDRTYL